MSALPHQCHPVVQQERNLLENRDCTLDDLKFMCHQMAEDFQLRNAIFPPLLSEFLMLGFYEVGRGAFSCCLRRTPISVLINNLWRIGTHRPRNTHSTTLLLFAPTQKYFSLLTSWLLSVRATSVSTLLPTPDLHHL